MSIVKIKDNLGNWISIDSVIKPVSVPILITTPSYNIPASGGEFWVDTVAAGSNVTLTLPLNPAKNTIVSVQIIDNTARDLFIVASPSNFLSFQAAGAIGKYAGSTRNLIEAFKFYNGRWLQFYNRFIYA